jgi:cytochrome c oxidase assembly factor CtaG
VLPLRQSWRVTHPHLHWNLTATVVLALGLYAGIYVWRWRAARREEGGRGAGPVQLLCFAVALAALTAAIASPIDGLGEDYLFSMHMLQHILLGDIAPVFLLLALSRVIMRPATRRLVAVERALGRFAHPLTGLFLWFGLVYLWHIPALYDAAIQSDVVHALEHASFFTAGVALWWPLIQPVPMRRRMRGMWPFAYIAAAKLGLAGLGLYLTWSTSVAYEHYETVPRIWGLTAVEDQNVGGAMMMLEQSVVLLIAFVVLFVQMLTQSEADEQRRERLERAAHA